jgi:hypothetical protein
MACPQNKDGGENFQIWRVVANIMNMQSRTANEKWYSSLGCWRRN